MPGSHGKTCVSPPCFSENVVVLHNTCFNIEQGRRYLGFFNDIGKLSAPHEAVFRGYEKEAVATIQRAGGGLHQAHLDVPPTYKQSSKLSFYYKTDILDRFPLEAV